MPVDVPDKEVQAIYDLALEVARKAGVLIREAFVKEKSVETKDSEADLVTETDQAVEKFVHDMIKAKYPDHKFIGEETFAETGQKCELTDEPTWIIDPIDGTTNFVHRVQEVSFSLGVTINKKPVIGIVYAPVKEEMFTARLGQGAFCNDQRLKANSITELKKSLGIVEGGSARDPAVVQDKITNIHSILKNCHGFRAYGSCAINLCHVAAGRGDFYVEYGVHIWDFIAGVLIAQEAGASVCDPEGGELSLLRRRLLCACTPELIVQIPPILTHLDMGSD
ncbi:inositol monophosphatase 2 [Aplysia californica]|uniref:Inositol-1-monophosphatase n=1 Tax=Aplysia californica TaxID=6500 RepID=A0ABM0JMB6_APLCA|nr:inositol monophosphatase 2 [Aplysia californica]